MELSKIREMSLPELYKEVNKVVKVQSLQKLSLKSGKISELKNTRLTKKTLARIKTVILEKVQKKS